MYISVKTAMGYFVFTFSAFIENFDNVWVNRFVILYVQRLVMIMDSFFMLHQEVKSLKVNRNMRK